MASHMALGVAAIGVVALAAVPPAVSAAEKARIPGAWRSGDVTIDGLNGEWPDLVPFARRSPFSIAVANDDAYLYVALDTGAEASVTQMLRQGLIVWFDGAGGKKKRFGIRFPMGVPPQTVAAGRGAAPPVWLSPGAMWERAERDGQLQQLEILGADQARRPASVSTATPIQVGIRWSEGVVFYEIKVPLAKVDDLVGLGAGPGAVVGIGLETPEVDARRSQMPGAGGVGGMGSRGGFGGPGFTVPLSEWTTVGLAAGPAVK